jgi:fluoride exporter
LWEEEERKAMNPLIASLLVGAGGCVGSVARYGVSIVCQRISVEWPYGTLSANVLGCFVIGLIAALSEQAEAITPAARLLLTTGFCGGFTTMSSMIYETAEMLRSGAYFHASLYVCITGFACLVAFSLGFVAIRFLARTGGGPWN